MDSLLPHAFCTICFHDDHEGRRCAAPALGWDDPAVGGDPNREPPPCGCDEFVNTEMRGRIMVATENEKSFAPWTVDEVECLRWRQSSDVFHPYTCPQHSQVSILTPTERGWMCLVGDCDYWQGWAHAGDVTFDPKDWPSPFGYRSGPS